MSGRAREGHKAERKTGVTPAAIPADALEQSPLDFALSFMRDDSKPDALRVSVAKAALPYLHTRGEEQEKETDDATEPERKSERMSDLEVARRIAHILLLGEKQEEREAALVPGAASEVGYTRLPQFKSAASRKHPTCGCETVRRRTGTVTGTVAGTVPDQQCITACCTASGTRATSEAPAQLAEAQEPAQRSTEPDPHPGYRWIP